MIDTLKSVEVAQKYKCFKERADDLKKQSIKEGSRFTMGLIESAQMVDYLYKELMIAFEAVYLSTDTMFCQDREFCEKVCGETCVKAAATKFLHRAAMDYNKTVDSE